MPATDINTKYMSEQSTSLSPSSYYQYNLQTFSTLEQLLCIYKIYESRFQEAPDRSNTKDYTCALENMFVYNRPFNFISIQTKPLFPVITNLGLE